MIVNHNHEIDEIYNIIISMPNMNQCALSNCAMAIRHHRDRAKENKNIESKESDHSDDIVMFWRETLDACHCYLFHLYDLGLRIRVDTNETQNNTDCNDYKRCFDAHFAAICKKMKSIKANLNKLKQFTFTRYENNK
eukprot:28037_1